MAKRSKTFFEESLKDNTRSYSFYLRRLTELSMAMFDWQNVPETIDTRYLELTLFNQGSAVFFRDADLGYLALKFAVAGQLDVYRIPVRRRAYSVNGYQKELTKDDSVIIWNNNLHTNTYINLIGYAKRLYNLERIIDVNTNSQKSPVVIQCDEKQRLTLLNAFKEMDGNAPVIFADKNIDLNSIKVLNTQAPYVSDRLYQLKNDIWNEALTYLGITAVNVNKKERLIRSEVSEGLGSTYGSRYSRLNARQVACEQINKMFGLDIWCEYKSEISDTDGDGVDDNEEGEGYE